MVLRARLDAALARRASPDLLTALDTDAIRLVDSAGDDLPRLTIERYRDAVRIGGGPEWAPALDTLRAPFLDTPVFWRLGHDCEGGPDGDAGDRVVREGDRRHPVSLAGRRNPGLFLDARPARAWAAAHSDGRRVLNLFAFTCAFGVAAARGGARSTVNVDTAAGALERGRRAYALNDLEADGRTFWRSDVSRALHRARKSGAAFDGVVLDPPPLAQRGGRQRTVDAQRHLSKLLSSCVEVLAPDGWLMLLYHRPQPTTETLLEQAGAAHPRLGPVLWSGGSDADCAADTLRAFVWRVA